jgi:hypothetical protein
MFDRSTKACSPNEGLPSSAVLTAWKGDDERDFTSTAESVGEK